MSREIGVVLGSSLGEVKEVDVDANGNCWGSWRFTGFYGDPNATNRSHSWSLIRRLAGLSNLPWLIGGDFNEILRWEEKSGGLFRSHKAISLFRGAVDDCNLVDVGFRGHNFTWSNRQKEGKLIQERLDRFLCCMRWRATFPNAANRHLDWGGSDHKPILMDNIRVATARDLKANNWSSRFHFEEAWIGEPDCSEVVENAWNDSPSNNGVAGLSRSVRCEKPEEMEGLVSDYFSGLFSSSSPSSEMIDNVIQAVDRRVTPDMNQILLGNFTALEIQQALKQMAPSKAPGPDSLPALFFQKFWGVVGDKVVQALLAVLNYGADMGEISRAVVALIPKVKSPIRISDYRPISLCNVTYKLVAKVLANRLKLVLNEVIAPSQSAFVPGRLITDNVVVGFECLHHLKNCRKGSKGLAALKLDMSKAYDRVEWIFLQKMMEKLGFDPSWISKVMSCITSASYSFLINGEPRGLVKPSRGLRQGCPLSPYLFLLCAEGLTSLLSKAEFENNLHGIKVARNAPAVSHLFFADDSLVFLRASRCEGMVLKDILRAYEAASGQSINFEKSALTFSPNTPAGTITEVRNLFGVDVVSSHDKYLGLPSSVGRNKKGIFGSILDNVWNKLQGWKGKLFSVGGKEILIKAIAQSVPAYAMSCFKLPVSIGLEIQKMCADFWWGTTQEKRKMHWFSWKRLCQPKVEGGMGFREFQAFNQAMLAKILKAKYFPNTNFLKSKLGWKPSFVWRSILWGRDTLQRGLRWKVGDGHNIAVYDDPWIPRASNFKVLSPPLLPDGTSVSALIGASGSWCRGLVHFYFRPEEAAAILSIPLCSSPLRDSLTWHFDKKGYFSVKSAYRLALKANNSGSPSSSGAPFPWACRESLPTKGNLFKRDIGDSNLCPFCSRLPESSDHALWGCKTRSSFWSECPFFSELNSFHAVDFLDRIVWVSSCCSLKHLLCFVVGSWFAWSCRNSILHNLSSHPASDFWSRAVCFVDSLLVPSQVPLQVECPGSAAPRWAPSSVGFKVNVDAAVDSVLGRFGIGIAVRDQQGCLKAAAALAFPNFFSVVAAETKAVLEGFRLAVGSGFSPFCVESDSLQVVNLCSGLSSSRCEEDSVIQDILFQFGGFINSLAFTPRSCNVVAHHLARRALGVSSSVVWNCSFPDWLLKLVEGDFCFVAS
ncbi:hypothetical protein ACOSQ4_003999 [Xanthoceras sorbifolium]